MSFHSVFCQALFFSSCARILSSARSSQSHVLLVSEIIILLDFLLPKLLAQKKNLVVLNYQMGTFQSLGGISEVLRSL